MIIAVGTLAGFINTVAGGGSLITLPMLIFLGLPAASANATNRLAIMAQSLFAVRGFRSKGLSLPMPYSIYLCASSIAGGIVGAYMAIQIDDHAFKRILAVVMIIVVALITINPSIGGEGQAERLKPHLQIIGTLVFFGIGVYGGFIQAGVGILTIAALNLINRFSLVKTNYIKVFSVFLYTIVAIAVFAYYGEIRWWLGIVLAIGQGLGGWYASRWSVNKGDKWIKRILIVTVVVLAVKLWFFG